MVEFGSGSSTKTPILLRAARPKAYVPIDISGDFLRESAARVDAEFHGLAVHPWKPILRRKCSFRRRSRLAQARFFPDRPSAIHPAKRDQPPAPFPDDPCAGAKLLIGMDR